MGDVPTGDGIERVLEEQSLLTPSRGEGGSVPRTLGSKAEERAKRRKKKKDSYARYLESATWKKIRREALKRDKSKCRACEGKAQVVHHVRYPKNLGEEKMEWLYSLCVPCHDAIHRAATSMTLKSATNLILNAHSPVTRLEDDWQLSPAATRGRQLRRGKKKPAQTQKKKRRAKKVRKQPSLASLQSLKISAAGPRLGRKQGGGHRKASLKDANDQLHEIQKRAREHRERRAVA